MKKYNIIYIAIIIAIYTIKDPFPYTACLETERQVIWL